MIINPMELQGRDRYKLLIGTILPRPIAWVSTMDAAGNLNVAPFSYFTIACDNPPTLLFCPQHPSRPQPSSPNARKDTLNNIEAVPEFVINLTNMETAAAMNLTATTLPPGQSEFEWAGLTPAPSETIQVPRVAEAPVAYECRLQRIVPVNEKPGGGSVVFGEVQRIYIRDDIYDAGHIRLDRLQPIGRLAGAGYTRVTGMFEMERIPPPPS